MGTTVKKKSHFRYDRIAIILVCLLLIVFVVSRITACVRNHNLAILDNQKTYEITKLQDDVNALKNEVNELMSRDNVVALASEDGITTNQDQVVIMGEDDFK